MLFGMMIGLFETVVLGSRAMKWVYPKTGHVGL